jgi:hypothetical protein
MRCASVMRASPKPFASPMQIEERPLLLVEAETADGMCHSILLQVSAASHASVYLGVCTLTTLADTVSVARAERRDRSPRRTQQRRRGRLRLESDFRGRAPSRRPPVCPLTARSAAHGHRDR